MHPVQGHLSHFPTCNCGLENGASINCGWQNDPWALWSSEAGCGWVSYEPFWSLSQVKFCLTQAGLVADWDSDVYSRIMGWVGFKCDF